MCHSQPPRIIINLAAMCCVGDPKRETDRRETVERRTFGVTPAGGGVAPCAGGTNRGASAIARTVLLLTVYGSGPFSDPETELSDLVCATEHSVHGQAFMVGRAWSGVHGQAFVVMVGVNGSSTVRGHCGGAHSTLRCVLAKAGTRAHRRWHVHVRRVRCTCHSSVPVWSRTVATIASVPLPSVATAVDAEISTA